MPGGDLRDCSVGGLTMRVLEPLQRYHLAYADCRFALDLEYHGLAEPYAPALAATSTRRATWPVR